MKSLPVLAATRWSPDLDTMAQRLKALADPTRLKIVDLLAAGDQCVCVLNGAIDVSQPLLSHHLRTLKEVGLVTDRREGRWVYYGVDRDALEELQVFLKRLGSRRELACAC
jgi:ArsR family transcriptional regulator